MKYLHLFMIPTVLLVLASCALFDAGRPAPIPVAAADPFTVPVSKHWQVIEEAPKLSDERGHLPFQVEQSLQPERGKPVTLPENRRIETAP